MSYFITFVCGFALGLGIALYIHLKNKWARDELVKEKATVKAQEKMNEILRNEIPTSKLDRINRLNELAKGSKD